MSMITLISCATFQEKAEELKKKISPYLAELTSFQVENTESAFEAVALKFKAALLLEDDENTIDELTDFLLGDASGIASIKARGDEGLTEEELEKRLVEIIKNSYPEVSEETAREKGEEWFNEQGYLTMIPYKLEEARRLVHRFVVAEFFRNIRKGGDFSIDFPETAWSYFSGLYQKTLFHYVKVFTKKPEMKILEGVTLVNGMYSIQSGNKQAAENLKKAQEEFNNQYNIYNNELKAKHEKLSAQVSNYVDFISQSVILPVHSILNFRRNMGSYVYNLLNFLLLSSLNAEASQIEMIGERVHAMSFLLSRIIQETKTQITMAHLTNVLIMTCAELKGVQKNEISEAFKTELYQIVIGVILETVGQHNHALAMKTANSLIRQKYSLVNSSQGSIRRRDLTDLPFSVEEASEEIEVLKSIDMIAEYQESDEDKLQLWKSIDSNLFQIFGTSQSKITALSIARRFFATNLMKYNGNEDFFQRLYALVLHFVDKQGDSVNASNFAQLFDETLDSLSSDASVQNVFVALKIYNVNMMPSDSFTVNFDKLNDNSIEQNSELVAKNSQLEQAIDGVWNESKDNRKIAHPTLSAKIVFLKTKSMNSEDLQVITWGKRLRV